MNNILMSCMHGWVTQRGVVLQGGNYEAICPGPYLAGSLLMHAVGSTYDAAPYKISGQVCMR